MKTSREEMEEFKKGFEVGEDESEDEWMSRCMDHAKSVGKSHRHAVGMCMGMWNEKAQDKVPKRDLAQLDQKVESTMSGGLWKLLSP